MISQHEQGRKYEVDENQDWMKDIAAMAHKMAPQDKMRERQAQRDAQAKAEQQQRLQQDVENLPDLISQYNDMEAEYESMGGSNWQYADREQNLSDKERKARGMETSMRHLANRIHAAKKASEGLAESKPDFGKMFDKKIGKHNKAVVKTKKEIGTRVADIGAGGKEYNVKTDKEWDKQQGVAEGSESSDNLVSTLNSFGYYSDNGDIYVNDSGDKIARQGSNWKHQSGKRGIGAEELGEFLGSKQGVAEGYQLDEGAVETITALVKKIPGIGKYYQMAQQYKPQLIEILKTSKSGKEVKQKMEQLAAGQSATVAESGMMKQLGGLAVGGGSILSTMWMNAMGMIDGVLAHAAAGEVGGAVASGSILGLIPVTLMLFAAMLLFKGSKQSSDEKAQAFQAQRGQQGMAEDLSEEFDLIESIVEMIAEHNGVDAEAVWEDLESLTEDELYVFAVTSDPLMEDWQKANKRDRTDGMSQKAVNAYRRENPGSKLKTAVTTKPSKLKKGGKASKRRKSYCSRSRGQMKMHSISCAKTPDKAICKARRRWNC
jgi:hypothetical protein